MCWYISVNIILELIYIKNLESMESKEWKFPIDICLAKYLIKTISIAKILHFNLARASNERPFCRDIFFLEKFVDI